MNPKVFLVLAALTAITTVAAIFAVLSQPTATTLQFVDERAGRVGRIHVRQGDLFDRRAEIVEHPERGVDFGDHVGGAVLEEERARDPDAPSGDASLNPGSEIRHRPVDGR